MNRYILIAVVLLVLIAGGFYFWNKPSNIPIGETSQPSAQKQNAENQPALQKSSSGAGKPRTPLVGNQGRVVFGIKDKAVDIGDLHSIIIYVKEILVENAAKGWISVSKTQRTYDLIRLRDLGKTEFLGEINLAAGTYQQIRFVIDKVLIISKSGPSAEAIMPSRVITLPGQLVVEKGKTSAALLDVFAGRSVYAAVGGEYIFAPVLRFNTSTQANTQSFPPNSTLPNGQLDIFDGLTKFDAIFGMDENGNMKINGGINPIDILQIENGAVKIIPR